LCLTWPPGWCTILEHWGSTRTHKYSSPGANRFWGSISRQHSRYCTEVGYQGKVAPSVRLHHPATGIAGKRGVTQTLQVPHGCGWMGAMQKKRLHTVRKGRSYLGRQDSADRNSLHQGDTFKAIAAAVRKLLRSYDGEGVGLHELDEQRLGPDGCPERVPSSIPNTPLAPSWVCQSTGDSAVAKPGETRTAAEDDAMQIGSPKWIGRRRSGKGSFHLSPSMCQVRRPLRDKAVGPGSQ